MRPAIVVGGSTMALGVIRCLGRRGVPVVCVYYDDRAFAQHSRYAVEHHRFPHPEREERDFVAAMGALGQRHAGAVVFPVSDASVATISRNRDALAEDFVVACGDTDATRLFLEKKFTYEVAAECGVPVPRTLVPTNRTDMESFAADARYPVLVKPSLGHLYTRALGRKMTVVHDEASLFAAWEEAADLDLEVMIQEIIPGPDHLGANYNCFAIDGRPIVEFTARKVRSSPIGFGSPCVVVSRELPSVVEHGRAVIKALGHDGFACVEVKEDPRTGETVLMEVNGRHNLSSLLAPACGIDFPWIHYDYLANGTVPAPSTFREGLNWIDVVRDLSAGVRSPDSPRRSLRSMIAPYREPKIFAILSRDDPKPIVHRVLRSSR